jgi:hypothetical protein
MSETKLEIKPPLDDKYWFDFSKEMVQNSSSIPNEAAAKLQSLIVWLWGIYTASATVGISLSKTSYPLPIILLIASPSAALILAYWLAVWAQMPIHPEFCPVIPATIREAYEKSVKTKERRLAGALAISLLAALLVSGALIGSSISKQVSPPDFMVSLYEDKNQKSFAITGHFSENTEIVLQITPLPPSGEPAKKFQYLTPSSGDIQTSIALVSTANKYEVAAEWKEKDGLVRSLKRIVVLESPK